eukprot:COSAG01_NODE_20156_length_967_cov_6.967742_2_plen_55_part_01
MGNRARIEASARGLVWLATARGRRDRVVYFCEGSYAEYAAVPASTVARVPAGLTL